MATDHNFRIKNGLEVGGQLIVNSSGQLRVATVSSNINLLDSVRLNIGSDSDLAIFHTGGNGVIHNTTGALRIRANTLNIQDYANEDAMITANSNGSVLLYHNNVKKLETTTNGVTITGGQVLTGSNGNVDFNPNGNEVTFTRNGANYIHASGSSGSLNFTTGSSYTTALTINNGQNATFTAGIIGVSLTMVNGTIKLDGDFPTGTENVALGKSALASAQSGASYNVGIGSESLNQLTSGDNNTAVGFDSLRNTTSGGNNTAFGSAALRTNTTGERNTAVGTSALQAADQSNNTAVGYHALVTNVNGGRNTAVGSDALGLMNASSSGNTYNAAFGYAAGANMTTGIQNTLLGSRAGVEITTANYNIAVGYNSLALATTGGYNVSIGRGALYDLTSGTL